MKIDISANLKELTRKLDYIQREQVPFAASVALNNVASDVAGEITRQMEGKLENPTPFTLKAYQFRPGTFRGQRSNKRNLTVLIDPAEIQKSYLRYQIEGGIRFPKQSKILVPSSKAPKNQYGNLSRANRKRLIDGKGKFFSAGTKEGKTPGIYLRTPTGIEPMAFYVQEAKYKPLLPIDRIAQGVVKSKFDYRFQQALQRALATAR